MKNTYFLYLIMAFCSLSVETVAQPKAEKEEGNESTTFVNKYIRNLYSAPPAPEAASLGKYGHTPMSLYTGVANISVPIYTIKGKSLSLPISLSYSTQGYKTDEIATWVGLGWSLNAGGVITRTVKGNPDIQTNYYDKGSDSRLETGPPTPSIMDPFDYYPLMYDIMRGAIETQPDMYSYNTPTGAGKFYISPSGKILKHDYNDLRIDASSPDVEMIITDEKGVIYKFRDLERTRIVRDDAFDAALLPPSIGDVQYTSSWYLSEIVSPTGTEKIKFIYQTVANVLQSNNKLGANALTLSWKFPDPDPNNGTITVGNTNENDTYVDRLFVRKIQYFTCENGCTSETLLEEVEFNNIDGRKDFAGKKALDNIKVYFYKKDAGGVNTSTLLKNFNLNYGYFNNPTPLSPRNNLNVTAPNDYTLRLRLESIQETGFHENSLGKSIPPYKFDYDTATLPELFSTATDHWGYFNNNSSTYLAPTPADANLAARFNGYSLANRETDETSMKAGILTKLTYPTGGYTTYEYEANRVNKPEDNSTFIVGGLRIKQMTDYSDIGQKASSRTYEYISADGTSSGKLFTMPEYIFFTSKQIYSNIAPNNSCTPLYTQYSTTLHSSSRYTMATAKGSHFGYSRVIEKMVNGSDNNGYKVYNYSNGLTEHPEQEDIQNGDLILEEIYAKDNTKVRETIFNYDYTSISQGFANLNTYRVGAIPNDDNRLVLCKSGIISNFIRFYFDKYGGQIFSIPSKFTGIDVVTNTLNIGQLYPVDAQYIRETVPNLGASGTTATYTLLIRPRDLLPGVIEYPCDALTSSDFKPEKPFKYPLCGLDDWMYSVNITLAGSQYVVRWKYSESETCPGNSPCFQYKPLKGKYALRQSWTLSSQWRYLVSKEERIYEKNSSGAYASVKTEYSYDKKHTMPNKELVYESDGSTSSIVKKYVGDFDTNSATDAMSTTLKKMKDDQNMVAVEVSNTKLSDVNRVEASINYFKVIDNNVQPDRVDALEISVPENIMNGITDNSKEYPKIQSGNFVANIPSSVNSYSTRVTVEDFDTYGNATRILKKDDAVSSCYVYGYHGRYVVAEIKGTLADCNTIKSNPDVMNLKNRYFLDTEINTLMDNLRTTIVPNAFITSYTYHPTLGITTSTDPSKRRTYYSYDELGRLLKIENHQKQVIKSYQYKYQSE